MAGLNKIDESNMIGPNPLEYQIHLRPNLKDLTFSGEVEILVRIEQDLDCFRLDSIDLDILETSIDGGKAQFQKEDDNQCLKVLLPNTSVAGSSFKVRVSFNGSLADRLDGFYLSKYDDATGMERRLAMTQMQPGHARKVFPCFDDPSLKARFSVSVTAAEEYTCISNMPIGNQEEVAHGLLKTSFLQSQPMSTYLLALAVGDLAYTEDNSGRVPIRVYTPIGSEKKGRFTLDQAAKVLTFYEDLFEYQYPLPKLDFLAAPDFAAGAMENWGLVIAKSFEILIDADSSLIRRQRVVEIVFHEVSHQWFGNLVTLKSWDGLWLNEGFATWMARYAGDKFYPEWHLWEEFVADTLQQALELDGLESSHPVQLRIAHASQVAQLFDAISYKKGSSILRMIANRVGEEVFLDGVRLYVKRHAFGNATTQDLWMSLKDASGVDVASIMHVWTHQVGYPVVVVTERENHTGSGATETHLTLTQHRFISSGTSSSAAHDTIYPLTIKLRTEHKMENFDFDQREVVHVIKDSLHYKINADHYGFYRTAYPLNRLLALGKCSEAEFLSVEDKVLFLADSLALAKSGHQVTSGMLDLISLMQDSKEYLVWKEIVKCLRAFKNSWKFQSAETVQALNRFSVEIVCRKARAIGWLPTDADDDTARKFKALMLEAAGDLGEPSIVSDMLDRFHQYCQGHKEVLPAEVLDQGMGIAVSYGGQDTFDHVLRLAKETKNDEERFYALGNLSCVKTPSLVQQTLSLPFSQAIRDSDAYLLLWCIGDSAVGAKEAWSWLQHNWSNVLLRLPSHSVGNLLKLSLQGLGTREQLQSVTDYFSSMDTKAYSEFLQQQLEDISMRVGWVEREEGNVKAWLRKRGYFETRENL